MKSFALIKVFGTDVYFFKIERPFILTDCALPGS